jgi:hypothetical protein
MAGKLVCCYCGLLRTREVCEVTLAICLMLVLNEMRPTSRNTSNGEAQVSASSYKWLGTCAQEALMTYLQISDNLDTVSSLQTIPAKWSFFDVCMEGGGEIQTTSMIPSRMANLTRFTMFEISSFFIRFMRCISTVLQLMPRREATSFVQLPSAKSRRTWFSR